MCCVVPVSCTDNPPLVPVLACDPLSAPPESSGFWSLCKGISGLFFSLTRPQSRAVDGQWIQLHTGVGRTPSTQSRRASGRVVEQHSHRRDDQYHAVGMYTLAGPWLLARHWLASLVSRTRQLEGDSAEPIEAAQPLGRGQGSEVTSQEKRGPPTKPQTFITRAASPS